MHQAPTPFSLSCSHLSAQEDLWNIKLGHAGLLCLLWAQVEGKVEMEEQTMTDKNRRGQGLWERATIAGACLGASLTSSGAVSGCEIAPISQVPFQ